MTEDMAASIRQKQMDDAEYRSYVAAKRSIHCTHMEACTRANAMLDGSMMTYDALRCEECPHWEAV